MIDLPPPLVAAVLSSPDCQQASPYHQDQCDMLIAAAVDRACRMTWSGVRLREGFKDVRIVAAPCHVVNRRGSLDRKPWLRNLADRYQNGALLRMMAGQ